MNTPETDATLDALARATGEFLEMRAVKACREQPAIFAVADAALKSGEAYTQTTMRIYPSGIKLVASVHRISDDQELVRWDDISATAMTAQ